ncbi:MAG: enoyl-CoA hydratase/isomerase family protein [Spirochaetota bacterium]
MNYGTIIYDRQDTTGVIRLNRPDRMNAVSEEMYAELIDVLEKTAGDAGVRSQVITGSVRVKDGKQKQAFCAGADLKKHGEGERTHAQKRAYIELAHRATEGIYRYPKPVIAAVNGPARGAGTEMALNCDFIFMAEDATLAFPETGLGTFVGGGVTVHLPKMIGVMKAKELVYTGRVINGDEAVVMGLAIESLPVNSLMGRVSQFCEKLGEKAPVSMKLAKERLQNSGELDFATALHLETDAILACMDTEDWHEGVQAFAEKRKPEYKGK